MRTKGIISRVAPLAVALLMLTACGGGGGGGGGGQGATPAPSALSYTSPQTWIAGQPITTLQPTVTGTVTEYSVSPALPPGVSLNTSTGVISGTPTAEASTASFTVTARNASGATTFSLQITVNPPAPSALVYAGPLVASVLQPVSLTPTVTGRVDSYGISPALPAGLSLNTLSGALTGVPRESRANATYTITARNGSGSTTYSLQLSVNSTQPAPASVSYQPFFMFDPAYPYAGQPITRYAWEGRRVALLTARNDLNPGVMQTWLDALDRAWDFYQLATGRSPLPFRVYNGKATIAEVPRTCGAGCGFLGATGIEADTGFFQPLYNSVQLDGFTGGFLLYEMGRNYWLFDQQVAYRPPVNSTAVITGFAVLMQWWSQDATQSIAPPDRCFSSQAAARTHFEGLVDLYTANTALTWQNTLGSNVGVGSGNCSVTAPDLFTSIFMRVARDFGGPNFRTQLWREVAARPVATTTPAAIDNLVLAASAAANRNLTRYFSDTLRWPISDAARAEAQSRFGSP